MGKPVRKSLDKPVKIWYNKSSSENKHREIEMKNTRNFSKKYRKSNPTPLEQYTINGVTVTGTDLGDAKRTYRRMVKAGLV